MNNLVKYIINNGGTIKPLIIPSELTGGTGLMNPSIYNDNGKLLCVLRHVNYTMYHSEHNLFNHQFGVLVYLHPENDLHLRTVNYLLNINDDLNITNYHKIDMSKFNTYEPMWDFVGLEDARIFRWDDKLYISGVRRDTTTNGEGRMELSEIIDAKEISRLRISTPNNTPSYCEKNWMPIIDKPYHYIKWTNPVEVVKVNIETGESTQVYTHDYIPIGGDFRGSSQVIKYGQNYLCIIHEVDLFKTVDRLKDGIYKHRFVMFDDEFNIIKYSDTFDFMNGNIEFCCGMCEYNSDIIVSFGFQDNCAFIIKFNKELIDSILNEK